MVIFPSLIVTFLRSIVPDGLDTYIGKDFHEEGIELSGEECQKIAIARSIFKRAPIVIMDGPTAALDPVSECEVYEQFSNIVDYKMATYISHRLASCRFCDKIIVLENSKIVQQGNFRFPLKTV